MIIRLRISEFFYFLGATVLFVTGIGFKSVAASGLGLYMLYSGRKGVFPSGETSPVLLKFNLLWDLIFLAISVLMLLNMELLVCVF